MTKARSNASSVNLDLTSPREVTTVTTSVPTATTNFDLLTQGVYISTGTTTANVTLNFRGNSSTTLNNTMFTNDAWTGSFIMTNGATSAYYISTVNVDGTTSGVTTKWSGGTAPAAGNLSSADAYSFTIVKTASSTYTVFAAGPVKYA